MPAPGAPCRLFLAKSSPKRLLPQKMQHDLTLVRRAPVLEEIDALPSPKNQPPRRYGDSELRLQQRRPDMGRHVVETFAFVDVALAVFWRDRLEKIFQIRPDIGVGVLLNEKRGGGMAAKDREQAGHDRLFCQPGGQWAGDLDKTFAAGLNVQGMERLSH